VIVGVLAKYKKIAWAQSFCVVFVLGQFFSIWLAGLDDMDRHLIPSYPFIIQMAGSLLAVLTAALNKKEITKHIV